MKHCPTQVVLDIHIDPFCDKKLFHHLIMAFLGSQMKRRLIPIVLDVYIDPFCGESCSTTLSWPFSEAK